VTAKVGKQRGFMDVHSYETWKYLDDSRSGEYQLSDGVNDGELRERTAPRRSQHWPV
jgi:hypothetical protein